MVTKPPSFPNPYLDQAALNDLVDGLTATFKAQIVADLRQHAAVGSSTRATVLERGPAALGEVRPGASARTVAEVTTEWLDQNVKVSSRELLQKLAVEIPTVGADRRLYASIPRFASYSQSQLRETFPVAFNTPIHRGEVRPLSNTGGATRSLTATSTPSSYWASVYAATLVCKKTTREVGKDELRLGGILTTDNGQVSQMPDLELNKKFKKGTTKTWNPAEPLGKIEASSGPPTVLCALIFLAERDNGDFGEFLKELYATVREEAESVITAYISAAIGAILPPLLATIAAHALTWVAMKVAYSLISWLAEKLGDDIFPPQEFVAEFAADACGSGTSESTAPVVLQFAGFGGEYELTVYGELSRS